MIRQGIMVAGAALALATTVRTSHEQSPHVPPKPLASVQVIHQVDALVKGLVNLGAPRHQAPLVARAIYRHTKGTKIDPFLVAAIIAVENPDLDPTAYNPSGATGIMQVMRGWLPVYGRICGWSLRQIDSNICIGVHVLRSHIADMRGSLTRGIQAYGGCADAYNCWYAAAVLTRYDRIKPHATPKVQGVRKDTLQGRDGG